MAAAKKQRKIGKAKLKQMIINLVRKHGKVKLISREHSFTYGTLDNYRARKIHLNGNCVVAYKGSDYNKFSGYSTSCFVPYEYDEYEELVGPKGLKQTVNALFSHDGAWLVPYELCYGKRFKKKVKLWEE